MVAYRFLKSKGCALDCYMLSASKSQEISVCEEEKPTERRKRWWCANNSLLGLSRAV